MDTYDNDNPTSQYIAFNPAHFRNIIQRQINTSINTQMDVVLNMGSGKADGRYSSSLPSTITYGMNQYGLQYFIAGKSIVGQLYVAAP